MNHYDRARFCVVIVSEHYADKLWTSHELKQAQARVFSERSDYILPVRLDDVSVPGLNETIGHLDGRTLSVEEIGDAILKKLFHDSYRAGENSA